MATAVDFAARLIDPVAIRDAGHSAVIAYVAPSRPGSSFGAKPITKSYADQLRAAGLDIASIFQFGKPGNAAAPSDWTTGYDGGQRMGSEAADRHRAAGGPDRAPIYFAVDEDISLADWNTQAVEFFRGVNAALGVDRTGIYGHSRACAWAAQDGVIGSAGGRFWAWQTRAWSGSEIAPEAVLYQRVIDTPSNPGPLIDGSSVDVNDILAAVYGQWSYYEQPEESPMVRPEFTEINRIGKSRSDREGVKPIYFLLHTQEGNGTAESLANYLNNPNNGVSYHYTVDNDGTVVDVVDTDDASWSVLDANSRSINLCFAGSRAAWGPTQWIENMGRAIDIAAYIAVQDCRKYGIPPRIISPEQLGRGEFGIADHWAITSGLGIGTHTDVGDGYPWETFSAAVAKYSNSVNGDEMGLLDETFENWKGDTVSVRTALRFIDKYNGLMIDQFNGPGSRERDGEPTRWEMLGGRTLVEALAIIGETLGIEGFGAGVEPVHAAIAAPVATANAEGVAPKEGQ